MSMKEKMFRGSVGVISPLLGASVSLSAVEAWLRVTSLAVGIAVGVVTILMLLRPWWKERQERLRRPWERN
jgi:4-amino-4-deoxy-L-arabinose transferase-like glycosyltransferase